ncbi:hypothetical protein [Paenibacillus sp. FSL K6-2524]|uniref:hypothetical protein n=1 Tax=Paenibacillus sp. FSL K6-2524 TaxID=2954516 RepID=UPI0030FC4F2C
MSKRKHEIIQAVLTLYKDMYNVREIFRNSYFKYTPEEVIKEFEELLIKQESLPTNDKTVTLKDSILALSNEEDMKRFYLENLVYDHSDINAKEERLKTYSVEEYKYMYNILYSSPPRSNIRKGELLSAIEKYFDSIDRAKSMMP